jgi:diaminopimelate decarboxylase
MNKLATDHKVIDFIRTWAAERVEPVCAYIYDLQLLRERTAKLVGSLPKQCRLFYAIKANSDSELLKVLAPIVHGFEAASLGEICKIRQVSDTASILFGGPGKTEQEIEGAIEQRVSLIHAESEHELRRIQRIGERLGKIVPVLLRVNLRSALPSATLAMGGKPTQFGIDEEDVPTAIRLALSLSNIQLDGFHLHSISNNLDALRHAELVSLYLERVRQWSREFGLSFSYLNAGGGIGVNYNDLDQQFDWNGFMEQLDQIFNKEDSSPSCVLFEPGRYITAGCGWYAAQVIDLKRNHGKHYAIIRGGTHHFRLPVSWQHSHPFEIIHSARWDYSFPRAELLDSEVTIVGQLCTPKDVLTKDVRIERLRIGDIVLFQYAGAYGWTISHHDFLSHPHPEHVYLD